MDEREFTSERTGKTAWEQEGMYFRFEPKILPHDFQITPELQQALFDASINLGRLDGVAKKFTADQIELILLPFLIREATLSSEIEGTRSTITDIYKSQKEPEQDPQKALDNQEVDNYIKAMKKGLARIKTEDFSTQLIQDLHRILLSGARGQYKDPGKYKTYQNAIGSSKDDLHSAKFVPASAQTTPALMDNLLEFLNNNRNINPLFAIAIAHYQFEAIHPFRDGNGRIGRLIIALYLCKKEVIAQPLLYISEFFNKYRREYIDHLYSTSAKGDLESWLLFCMKAINEQAQASLRFAMKLENYKAQLHQKFQKSSRSSRLLAVIDLLFENPYITITDISARLNVTYPPAKNMINTLVKEGILELTEDKKRNKIYLAKEILNILEID